MTIIQPETYDVVPCECAECGNDTFKAFVVVTARGSVKIKGVECAICGDKTPFSPAPPEEFN